MNKNDRKLNKSAVFSLVLVFLLSGCGSIPGQHVDGSGIEMPYTLTEGPDGEESTPVSTEASEDAAPAAEAAASESVPKGDGSGFDSTQSKKAWVNASEVNVREKPNTAAKVVASCDFGEEITVLGSLGSWTKISTKGTIGYMWSEYVVYENPVPEVTPEPSEDEDVLLFEGEYEAADGPLNVSETRNLIFEMVNTERAKEGLPELSYDTRLQAAANTRSLEQAALFSHTRPSGEQWSTAFPSNVLYVYKGENLAAADSLISGPAFAEGCVNWWMESPGHRANIMNGSFTATAIGIYVSGENMYAVQLFGTPGVT